MSAKTSADRKPQDKKIMLSSGRGGSGNIRRVKSTKEMGSRPLASPRMLELEPPRNRAAYGGRGGSGNVWTHVIEEGVFDRVLNYEISRARVLKEERAHEKAERRRSGGTAAAATAIRARSQSDAKPASAASADSRSLASAPVRKSWVSASASEVSVSGSGAPRPAERRISFANAFLAPLRNTFRSSTGDVRACRSSSELAQHGSSESGHSGHSGLSAPPSDQDQDQDQASFSLSTHSHLSPSTPNLSPSSPALPAPPAPPLSRSPSSTPRRRWTASGQRLRPPATDRDDRDRDRDRALARTRHLSNPLPPPTQPIPPIPHVHFVPVPQPRPVPVPMPMPISATDDDYSCSPPTPTMDDSYGLLDAAAAAASKARLSKRRPSIPKLALSRPSRPAAPSPTSMSAERPRSPPWYRGATADAPSPSQYPATARSTNARIASGTEADAYPERRTAAGAGAGAAADTEAEGDLIDPCLLSEEGGDGRCSVRGPRSEAPTVSSLSSVRPWLQDHDLDSIVSALSNAE